MHQNGLPSDISIINIRLAVRQIVAEIFSKPSMILKNISQPKNFSDDSAVGQIRWMIHLHLKHIYDRLEVRAEIVSRDNCVPSPSSIFQYLSIKDDETSNEIVQRFENRCISARAKKLDASTSLSLRTVNVPRLDTRRLSSNSLSSELNNVKIICQENSDHCEYQKNEEQSSSDQVWSTSPSNSSVISKFISNSNVENDQSVMQSDEISEKIATCFLDSFSHRSQRNVINESTVDHSMQSLKNEITKLAREVIPSVLSETNIIPSSFVDHDSFTGESIENKKAPIIPSNHSTQRSDDDKATFRYIPSKVVTAEIGIVTDSLDIVEKFETTVDIGVNTTICGVTTHLTDGSSSTNTFSDISTGQVPKSLVDAILQKPSVNVITIRPDGSVVIKDQQKPKTPLICEWEPYSHNLVIDSSSLPLNVPLGEKSNIADDEEEIEWVSAAVSSHHTASEEDTLAQVSPLPRQL
ncbi:unnamed protein product [Dracunculus medinensis]|uniref:Pecanex-like protein n=1 Tax=Dracunculus medinensis TaxID=318479 RepID=A0A0N4U601_DRAME|nr:unnamed protein product [Dracunculus medinensis]